MNTQALIVLFLVAALLLLGGCFMLLALVVFIFLRSGSGPEPIAQVPDASRVQSRLPQGSSVPPPMVPLAPPPAPPPVPQGLGESIGLMEDEGAKTEVFQRGMLPADWDDDEEGEATEIFRADLHGARDDGYNMD